MKLPQVKTQSTSPKRGGPSKELKMSHPLNMASPMGCYDTAGVILPHALLSWASYSKVLQI